jgi:hypothetical protein
MAIAQPSTVTPGVEQDAYPDTRQLLRMFDGRTESAPASTTATSTSATPQGNRIKNRNYLKIFVFKNLRFIL